MRGRHHLARSSGDYVSGQRCGRHTGTAGSILARFRQAQTGVSRELRRCGPGLAIAGDLVELHGGSISVADAAGRGALFQVVMPRHAPKPRMYELRRRPIRRTPTLLPSAALMNCPAPDRLATCPKSKLRLTRQSRERPRAYSRSTTPKCGDLMVDIAGVGEHALLTPRFSANRMVRQYTG